MKKNHAKRFNKAKGQAIVEYIIIIVIVAVAAFVVLGAFSDRIRTMIAGVAATFGATDVDVSQHSTEIVKEIDEGGIDTE